MKVLSILLILAISANILPVHGYQDNEVIDLLLQGIESHKNGNLTHALDCFSKAAEKDPVNYVAWLNKGLVLSSLGNYSEAIMAFNKALMHNNMSISTWRGLGDALDKSGDTFGAVNAYYNITKIFENKSVKRDAWMDIGITWERYFSKHPENTSIGQSAIEAYNRAIDLNPDFEKAYYNKGNVFQNMSDYKNAINAYKVAISKNKSYIKAYYNLGNALFLLSKYDEAIDAYNNAIKIDPKYARAWHNKGVAFWKTSKNGEAILALDKALDANPLKTSAQSKARTFYVKGLVIAELGRFDESINLFIESIDKDPKFKDAYYAKGLALAKMNKYEDAIKSFDAAIKLDPQYEAAWSQRGTALSESNRDVESLESFEKSLELNYSSFNLYGKGLALYKLGCFEEALLIFHDVKEQEKRISLYPTKSNFIPRDMIFLITVLFNILCLAIIIGKKFKSSITTFMMLLNISEFFTFGSILITVLHQAVYLKYISVGLSIVSLTMIFLITINRDVSRIKKRFISAAHNFEKENKNIFFLKIIGFLIIMYYTLISATLYLLPSGPTLMLFYKLGIISVLIFGLIYTLPILYKFIKFSGNDKAALDDIFAIYSGYLGLNALLSYWIIWSFGIIIINPKKILLYNTTLDMYVVIIIISIIVVLLMSPYIISMRNLSVAQNDSNNITSRIWAGFVTLFSLFLGPALSELIIKLGMPISSVDFPALITKGLLMN